MLLARAFVLSTNARGVLAVLTLAMTVTFALLTSGATAGLQDASEQVSPDFLAPGLAVTPSDGGTFRLDRLAGIDGATIVTEAREGDTLFATVRPWPLEQEAARGPYATVTTLDGEPLPVARPDHGSWSAILLAPDRFDERFPELTGQGSQAYIPSDEPVPSGFTGQPAPASGRFFVQGAEQVTGSVHAVVVAMGVLAAVLASASVRLEVQARRQELATLEVLGGRRRVRWVVAARSGVLAVAGVAVGVALSVAAVRAAQAAFPGIQVAFSPGLAMETVTVAFAAAWLAGAASGLLELKGPVAHRLGKRGLETRRFPGPVRFLLVTPRLFVPILAAALVTTAIVAVTLGVAQSSDRLLGSGEDIVIVGRTSTGNPFTGQASAFLGEHASLIEGVEAASPESFAPTLLDGRPVMVRGVRVDAWRAVDDPELVRGVWPSGPNEATVGLRLAREMGFSPGDTVVVPGAHRPVLRQLTVVGIHEGAGLADDEIVTSLDVVGDLAGLEPEQVNLIRLKATSKGVADRLPGPLGIEVAQLHLEPPSPVPGTMAEAQVQLVNLADHTASRRLTLRVNGEPVASQTVQVGPEATGRTLIPFAVPEADDLTVEVNPTMESKTSAPGLTLVVSRGVPLNETFTLRVVQGRSDPAANATVLLDREPLGTTNERGRLNITLTTPGRFTLAAQVGSEMGGKTVYVRDRAWLSQAHLIAETADPGRPLPLSPDEARFDVRATITNLGGQTFQDALEAKHGNETVGTVSLTLGPLETRIVTLGVTLPLEARNFTLAGLEVPLVQDLSDGEGGPQTVEEVLEKKREDALAQAQRSDATERFLDDLLGDLRGVVVVVVLITFLHAGAAVALAVLREVRERASVADTMLHLGASREDVAFRAGRDAMVSLLAPVVVGCALGLALLSLAAYWGYPPAFGHTLPADLSWLLLVRMAAALLVVGAGAAVWGAFSHRRSLARQSEPVPLASWLEGTP